MNVLQNSKSLTSSYLNPSLGPNFFYCNRKPKSSPNTHPNPPPLFDQYRPHLSPNHPFITTNTPPNTLSERALILMHTITSFCCMVILYLDYDMGLHYLTFVGTNVENRKKLRLVRILNSVGMNSTNIVNKYWYFCE